MLVNVLPSQLIDSGNRLKVGFMFKLWLVPSLKYKVKANQASACALPLSAVGVGVGDPLPVGVGVGDVLFSRPVPRPKLLKKPATPAFNSLSKLVAAATIVLLKSNKPISMSAPTMSRPPSAEFAKVNAPCFLFWFLAAKQ
jgi:hypothetical protein